MDTYHATQIDTEKGISPPEKRPEHADLLAGGISWRLSVSFFQTTFVLFPLTVFTNHATVSLTVSRNGLGMKPSRFFALL
jgi:hypothetical protein